MSIEHSCALSPCASPLPLQAFLSHHIACIWWAIGVSDGNKEEAAELVSHYDSKQNLHLEHEEWSAMLEDVVTHRGDWSGCAVRKTVADLVEIRQEIAEIGLELDDIMKVKRERYAALIRHVKARGGGGAKHKGEAPPP